MIKILEFLYDNKSGSSLKRRSCFFGKKIRYRWMRMWRPRHEDMALMVPVKILAPGQQGPSQRGITVLGDFSCLAMMTCK